MAALTFHAGVRGGLPVVTGEAVVGSVFAPTEAAVFALPWWLHFLWFIAAIVGRDARVHQGLVAQAPANPSVESRPGVTTMHESGCHATISLSFSELMAALSLAVL
jgi:hypothetical protein